MVAFTWLRSEGFATNGAVTGLASAQPYTISAERSQRDAANSRPPRDVIHPMLASSMNKVASAGVLYVWSSREFSSASGRLTEGGTQRSAAASRSIRSIAAGEHS